MLKLKELRLKAVGRFVEEQVIDFTELGNLVQVDGENKNTNGSSGAGKSTVFNALDFLLGLNDLPNSVLQSRLTRDTHEVTGVFDLDGKPLIIQRGKKLSIDLNGEVTTGSAKLSEEKLDQILAMPRHLFRPMLHKRQKEGGFFLKFTPKETHEFLTDCLGLSDLRKKLEKVELKVTELTNLKNTYTSQLDSAKASLEATQNALLALGLAPVKDIHQEVVLALKNKMDASMAIIEEVKARHRQEREGLEAIRLRHRAEREALEATKPKPSVTIFDLAPRMAWEKELNEVRAKAQSLLTAEKDRQMAAHRTMAELRLLKSNTETTILQGNRSAVKASELAQEIQKIRRSMCPTCEQTWVTEQAKAKENDLLAQVRKLGEEVAQGRAAQETLFSINKKLDELALEAGPRMPEELPLLQARESELTSLIHADKDKERNYNTSETAKIQAVLGAFVAEQADMALRHSKELQDADPSIRHSREIEQASGQADLDRRAFEAAANKLRAYQDALNRYNTSLTSLKNQEVESTSKVGDITSKLGEATKNLEIVEELKKAIKSYTSCAFDEALEYIGDAATKIIRSIPNMANATIQLEGVRETNAGKIKEEVNAVIHMDGEESIPIKSLSGGERSSVDLAVDLAVIDLLENKTGKGIDIFILDEPFTGLDTVSIEMALEVLKNSNLSKRLVIVDHNPEVKQMVESRLVVVRDGSTSKIVQQ